MVRGDQADRQPSELAAAFDSSDPALTRHHQTPLQTCIIPQRRSASFGNSYRKYNSLFGSSVRSAKEQPTAPNLSSPRSHLPIMLQSMSLTHSVLCSGPSTRMQPLRSISSHMLRSIHIPSSPSLLRRFSIPYNAQPTLRILSRRPVSEVSQVQLLVQARGMKVRSSVKRLCDACKVCQIVREIGKILISGYRAYGGRATCILSARKIPSINSGRVDTIRYLKSADRPA